MTQTYVIKNEAYNSNDILFMLNRHFDSISLLKMHGVIGLGSGCLFANAKEFGAFGSEFIAANNLESEVYTAGEVAHFVHYMNEEFAQESGLYGNIGEYTATDEAVVKQWLIIASFLTHEYADDLSETADVTYQIEDNSEIVTPECDGDNCAA